jgi:hypothetical protein
MNAKSEEWVRDTILAIRQLLFQSRVSVVLFLGVFAAHPYYFISLFSSYPLYLTLSVLAGKNRSHEAVSFN